MKKSGWSIAGVLAYLAVRFGVVAMRHPDWNGNDWAGFLGITAIVLVVVLTIVWLVKKARAPKPVVAAALANGGVISASAIQMSGQEQRPVTPPVQNPVAAFLSPVIGNNCPHCGSQFEPGSNFCCECGGLVA